MPTRPGFTLVELLVVISIIVVLIALLVPSMENSFEQARRAQCASNQHAISIATTDYATQHNGELIPVRNRSVIGYFSPGGSFPSTSPDRQVNWMAALASVGLFERTKRTWTGFDNSTTFDHGPTQIWSCPSTPFKAGYFSQGAPNGSRPDDRHFLVNYAYMGGVMNWRNRWYVTTPPLPAQTMESRSPVRMQLSSPDWVLAADNMTIVNQSTGGSWGGPINVAFGIPNHRDDPKAWPAGGNHLHMDGSVAWRVLEETTYLHAHASQHVLLFAQNDKGGWNPPEEAKGAYWKK